MANTFFIIHGSFGSPFENWFPSSFAFLTKEEKRCFVPHFPSPVGQTFENWSKILKSYSDKQILNSESVIICHSSSCPFVLKFAKANNFKFKCLITVSGFNNFFSGDTDFDKINSEFYLSDNELTVSADLFEVIYSFYSDNDPYIDIATLESFADKINSNKIQVTNAGHFNVSSGFNEFIQLNELCKTLK